MFDFVIIRPILWSFLENNQATVQILEYLFYPSPNYVQDSFVSGKPQNPYKNLEKSSRKSCSVPSALPSSPPSLSQPKTPRPCPSIAIPVLEMKENNGVKSSAESKLDELSYIGSSCSGIIAGWAILWG